MCIVDLCEMNGLGVLGEHSPFYSLENLKKERKKMQQK